MTETDERSPLHWAVMNGDLPLVNKLIQSGDDPNTSDESGWTPLMSAASAGFAQICDSLLQAGAKTNIVTKENRCAFFYAVSRCNIQVIDLFFQNGLANWKKDKFGMNPLHRAIANQKCSTQLLQMFKENDAPFDIPDPDGNLPIHIACYENRRDLVDWMVKNIGASVKSPKNNEGKVPEQLFPDVAFNA
ncbi:26S proteasome non-ATPase regulatory subunit 10 [Tritrichomonas foetus]|uniref:26S proteasome non-ATPase regulatory subunit 10 n=1 Tax=Tritrichomonas foetus TaxID=1144522 RepID=A0A1J4JQR7_9EUKA|nr:26S proteasome non-ATPase regulatory subunit 10 [Tritrichomonas foetus]|eukprot:OHS99588.1 26S proteasome non-ATPase regulatory subunit 10 [Tritrichomonas foetus]